jgi:hypothetical protein
LAAADVVGLTANIGSVAFGSAWSDILQRAKPINPKAIVMSNKVQRRTVDLTGYPNLVVIYLGMRVNALVGLKTLLGFGPQIAKSVQAQPDGLLLHENFLFSLFPPHAGMRQYWRDFEALERWARSEPHRLWWQQFLRNSGGTGFWHEAYFMRGGMEAVYDDMVRETGFLRFAPQAPARGPLFSSRERLGMGGTPSAQAPMTEEELYADRSRENPR